MAERRRKSRVSVSGPGRVSRASISRPYTKTTKRWTKYPHPINIYTVGLQEQLDIMTQLERSIRFDTSMMTSAVNAVGEKLAENFATAGRSQGKNWAPLSRSTYDFRRKAGYAPNAPPLVRGGALEVAINEHLVRYQASKGGFSREYTSRIKPKAGGFSKKAIYATHTAPGGGGEVDVKATFNANRNRGSSVSTMTISGEAVINNRGGRVGRSVIPKRPFWFMTADIKQHSVFMVQGVLNAYFNGANKGLKASAPSKSKVAAAARRAYSVPAATSRQALATINAEILSSRASANIRKVNVERLQRARREREAQNFYWMLSQSDAPDLGLASFILRHRSGMPMTLRYRRPEQGRYTPGRRYMEFRGMIGSVTGRGKTEHIVRVGGDEESLRSMEDYFQARAVMRAQRSRIRNLEAQARELETTKTAANKREVDSRIRAIKEEIAGIKRGTIVVESKRIKTIKPEAGERMAIRYYVALSKYVEASRVGIVEKERARQRGERVSGWKTLPYKRWQRQAITSFEPISPDVRLRMLMTGVVSPGDVEPQAGYAIRHISALRTAPWAFGQTLGEQAMLMRGEIARLREMYPDVDRVPFRYAENTPEGRRERELAMIAPGGLVITGSTLQDKSRFERTRSYGGSKASITIRRHSIATNLIEAGNKLGMPVLVRAAQELLSHRTDTVVRNTYGVHAFQGEGDRGTTARMVVPDWSWTEAELLRNRVMQLNNAIEITSYLMNRAFEQSHYQAMYSLAAHMIGLYQAETKNRSGFHSLDFVRSTIEDIERTRDIELSRIAGRPVVGPRFFSARREMSMAPNYEDPLMVRLGLSNRPNDPLPNERYTEDPTTGARRAITRTHVNWFDPSSGILGVDPETAMRSGLMDEAGFSPDLSRLGALNDMWARVASERFGADAIQAVDGIKRQDAAGVWRDTFTPPSSDSGEYRQNWWQYQVYGAGKGQAYYGTSIQSPFGQVFGSRVAKKMKEQSLRVTAETIAELERERPELFDVLSDYDKWRIIGLRETMAWVRSQEERQSKDIEFFSSARRRFRTRKEIARERMQR